MGKGEYFKKFVEKFKEIRSLTISLGIIAVISIAAIISYFEMKTDVLFIAPFEMPKSYIEKGYNGRTMANKLMDQLKFIVINSKTAKSSQQFAGIWDRKQTKVEILGTSISISYFSRYLKDLFGHQMDQIRGEVTLIDAETGKFKLTIRIVGKTFETFIGTINELDKLLFEAAKHIFINTDPYILAAYHMGREENSEKKQCLRIIKRIIMNDSTDDKKWAFVLWGNVLRDQKKYEEAENKFRMAIKEDKTFYLAHLNLGNLLCEQDRISEAIKEYMTALNFNRKNSAIFTGLGTALSMKGDYVKAIKEYRKAIKINSNCFIAYSNWGSALLQQSKFMKAIKKYRKAIEINSEYTPAYFYIGLAYYALGDDGEAIREFERYLEIKPDGEFAEVTRNYIKSISHKLK